jgi:structural maintenance of chromosome 4
VANYIKERTKNAQFIVISLRNNMFELAARLVGVYKVNHMTKSVTIENKDYIARPPTAGGNGGGVGGSSQQQHTQRTGFIGGGGGLTTTLALR